MQQAGHEGRRSREQNKYARVVELNESQKETRYLLASEDASIKRKIVGNYLGQGFVKASESEIKELGLDLDSDDVLLKKPYTEWETDKNDRGITEQYAPEEGERVVDGVKLISPAGPVRREAVRFGATAKPAPKRK